MQLKLHFISQIRPRQAFFAAPSDLLITTSQYQSSLILSDYPEIPHKAQVLLTRTEGDANLSLDKSNQETLESFR